MLPTSDVLALLRARRSSLPPVLLRVAHFVLEHPSAVVDMSTAQLASAAGASEAAVSRLCERIGLSGYPALKSGLAVSLARAEARPTANVAAIDEGTDARTVIDVVARSHEDAIQLTAEGLDPEEVDAVSEMLRRTRTAIVYALASSSPVAEDLARKLVMAGVTATATSDRHLAAALIARYEGRCGLIVISTTGYTQDSVSLAEAARLHDTPVVAVTSDPESRLVRAATHVLRTSAYEEGLRSGGTSDRIAQLLVVDVLVTVLRSADHHAEIASMHRMDEAVGPWKLPRRGPSGAPEARSGGD
ncbi:MurR/RpiR family transcriptional regulator [Brachybacterium saurashtrense]|nr:MurR/RpiR family transcriptional regulator [Brachybacterium saurashtrense]